MKQIKNRKRIRRIAFAICMFITMAVSSSICQAVNSGTDKIQLEPIFNPPETAIPTLYSNFATLIVGDNDLKVENYDGSQTMAGCFIAPEKGKYSFYAVNTGWFRQRVYLLNKDFQELGGTSSSMGTSERYSFGTYILEKGEKIYFYACRYYYPDEPAILASRLVITKEVDKPTNTVNVTNTPANNKKIALSKKSCTLKKGKKVKLKLKNNKKKVTWISREKKIASVSSKGVVKARKKGTTYIYAIANHKLYKCKVKVC